MKEKVLPYKQKYKGIQRRIVVKPDELNTAITSYTDIGATYNTIVDDFAKRVVERAGVSSAGHDDTKPAVFVSSSAGPADTKPAVFVSSSAGPDDTWAYF